MEFYAIISDRDLEEGERGEVNFTPPLFGSLRTNGGGRRLNILPNY